jgi:hypothetical protein
MNNRRRHRPGLSNRQRTSPKVGFEPRRCLAVRDFQKAIGEALVDVLSHFVIERELAGRDLGGLGAASPPS